MIPSTTCQMDLFSNIAINMFWDISKKQGITAPEFFRAAYSVLINKDSGPRLAPFILSIGQERVARVLGKV